MTQKMSVRHGTLVQRMLALCVTLILASLGIVAAWWCYAFMASPNFTEFRWIWIALTGVLSFFMLRGAWLGLFPPSSYNRPVNLYSTTRRF